MRTEFHSYLFLYKRRIIMLRLTFRKSEHSNYQQKIHWKKCAGLKTAVIYTYLYKVMKYSKRINENGLKET